jgi:hypothetical protein
MITNALNSKKDFKMNYKIELLMNAPEVTAYANDVDAFVPEFWAGASLDILSETLFAPQLVTRDYDAAVASFGDTVNTRIPSEFVTKRKGANDDVTVQDVSATNVKVELNQFAHISFTIKDLQSAKSLADLISTYIQPAMTNFAQHIERTILGQYAQFMGNASGTLNGMDKTTVKDDLLDAWKTMQDNNVPTDNRNMVWSTDSLRHGLAVDQFTKVNEYGDDMALRKATLGELFGFNNWQSKNMPSTTGTVTTDGAINFASGYAAGTTVLVVDGFSAAITANSWVSVGGNPHRVVSTSGGATPVGITLDSGLRVAVANDATVSIIDPGAVNLVAGYAVDYYGDIVVDGFSVQPQVGQMVTFGTSSSSEIYTIIGVPAANTITLDRPLESALSNDDKVNLAPDGAYNFAFTRGALAFVSRPLEAINVGGATSAVMETNGLPIRVTLSYEGRGQGILVTIDMLYGIKVLRPELGAVMLG